MTSPGPWAAKVLAVTDAGVQVVVAGLDRGAVARPPVRGGSADLQPDDDVLVHRDDHGELWIIATPFTA